MPAAPATAQRAASPLGEGASVTEQSLAAQAALLPQALGVFAVCLPIYVWAGSFAQDSAWMSASFAIFAINWGAFYFAVQQLQRPEMQHDTRRRARVHVLCGLLWSVAVWQMAAFANHAGPARETLLVLTVGAAVICLFFTTPYLPCLMLVGPAAMAGPLAAMLARPQSSSLAQMSWAAFALASMLSLILNQNLRRQFGLAAEREQLTRERTASLEEAERLARSKSALIATLSHEIRNGLTGVAHVLAAAAGQGGRAQPSREQSAAALAAANDLIAVLNATLDSETAESGRLSVDRAPFDPVRMVRDLAVQLRPQAAAKGLELNIFVEPQLEGRNAGQAMADPARVKQVLSNLMSNAVKYTTRGRVEARVERKGDDRIVIAIADTGPGLSPEELAEAFEPFKRLERTAAGVPGAGLGLSLSKRLVSLMGATLVADSAVGVGSCFTLELAFDTTALADVRERPVQLAAVPDGSMRVLMAEADGLNAAMLRTILEQLGHQVVHAQNGRRAVDLARAVGFDLIMLDGRMPEMATPDAITAIREFSAPVGLVPIIAVIGGDAAEDAGACQAAGADAVMRKPVSVAGVARAIAEAMAQRKKAAA
ncbi:MAG TPA: ATP-binding protein [Caulobacteraceae bacterium]|jgi:signal transduction histidine kinase/ActR/RegA family two-component response regulator|nr:ATP-binding protein [Caulobacteraceae bacterium]